LNFNFFETLEVFFIKGGPVLWAIFFTTFYLWINILERFYFFKVSLPKLVSIQLLKKKSRMNSFKTLSKKIKNLEWHSEKIKELQLSEFKRSLHKNISPIKTLVAICPLLGLLGTVTGMISVFDSLAFTGQGNARLMASGISQATIPTMAGMVAALSGLYFGSYFEGLAKIKFENFKTKLIENNKEVKNG
jgi:biopolymer transport protein ExbB